jgi:hypothetical protein
MAAQDSRTDQWRQLVRVRSRYQRSVHLERDAREKRALEGYILTPLVRTLTGRIIDGFSKSSPARAWSITGPYGTGKSAFALFLADVMSPPELDASQTSRRLLGVADVALAKSLAGGEGIFPKDDGLCPVLATGERRPLDQVLLRALRDFTQQFWSRPGAKPPLVADVAKAADAAAGGREVPARDIVSLFEQTAQKVKDSKWAGRGLIVILDEAGKLLEQAAQHPDRGDVQLLQELAEAANRSGDTPIVFVVLLHQAFEQYAGRLSLTERGEWAKVQGRFEDLAFQEASHELLRLVGEALERDQLPKRLRQSLDPLASTCSALVTRGGAQDSKKREALLAAALPLHPVTTLLLGPLFRSRLAQNERSLFAFLASVEPFGFQEFLDTPTIQAGKPSLFLPDALYDYVVTSLGSRLHGHLGKQWAQIEVALRRLPEGAGELEARLLKTIALLDLFGDIAGISASESTLAAIYSDGSPASKAALADALERLKRASLIIFRKFRNAYQLWEGSDLDVDALVRDALGQVNASSSLVQRLARVAPPRPIVARRHLAETGTFRYFELRYVEPSAFDDAFPDVEAHADGGVLLVIEPDASARSKFLQQFKQPMMWAAAGPRPVVVGVPRHVGRLLELGGELAALEWVQTHTPELHDDLVAQREVTSRLAEAERQLRVEVARLLGGAVACDWLARDKAVRVGSARALARVVSDLCDGAYNKAPNVQNELLNRRQLSSAAAAARRSLVEAMVTHAGEVRLGFEGTPPEVSMYRSFLEFHGLHRDRDGIVGFGPPYGKRNGSLQPAWAEIERALTDAQESRLRLTALFQRLRRPPFGLKDGLLPVLLVAAILAWKDEIALYEDGAFVSSLNGAVIERVLRAPDKFEVQRLSIAGPRAALYGRLIQTLSTGAKAPLSGLVPIVRQFVKVVRDLTDFARTTKTISPRTQAVREALQRAREPAPLLFHELPVACGLPSFEAKGNLSEKDLETFVEELRAAIRELQNAYPNLLGAIEDAIRTGLNLPAEHARLRHELADRAGRLLPVAVDAQLKAFLIRVSDEDLPRDEWVVSAGTLLGGKPPESWHDRDIDQMRLTLGLVCRRFGSLESMLIGPETTPAPQNPALLRVTVTQPGHAEQERVVPLRVADEALVASVCSQIRAVADSAAASLPREAIVAALGLVARDIMAEINDSGQAPGREASA